MDSKTSVPTISSTISSSSTPPPLPKSLPPSTDPSPSTDLSFSKSSEPINDLPVLPILPPEDEIKIHKKSKFFFDPSRRRSSTNSVKSYKSSRRGSKLDSEDDYDVDEVPNIPNITFRKGSIISAFPITDDLPCMRNKRSSICSTSSDKSEEVPPIAYRKSSFSIVYTVPDLLTLDSSIREDSQEEFADNDEKDNYKEDFNKENLKNKSKEKKNIDLNYNQMISHIGEFGIFQKYLILFMIPYLISYVFLYSSFKFITLLPEQYWCKIPELSNLSLEQSSILSIPKSVDNQLDHCLMYNVNYSQILESNQLIPDSNWSVRICEDEWNYNMTDISYASIAVENNWVCDKQSYVVNSQILFFIGSIFGGIILSWISDKIGRKSAIIGSNIIGFIGSVLSAFTSDIVKFSICRFITGIAHFNSFIFFYILVLEYVDIKWRTFALTFPFLIFYTIAEVTYPWIAFYIADWRWLSITTSISLFIGFILALFIPESARWQYATGQINKTIETLKKIEKINKVKIDPKLYTQLQESFKRKYSHNEKQTFNVFHLIQTKHLRKNIFICIVIWISIWFSYNGVMRLNSHFDLNTFSSFSLLGLSNIPSFLIVILILDVWGRKWLLFISLILTGLTLLLSTIDPIGIWSSVLACVGRLFINIAHVVAIQYSSEIFPSVVRSQGVNLVFIFATITSIVSPFIIQLAVLDPVVPLIILGLIGIFGALVCILLTESLGKDLPENLEHSKSNRDENLFDIPCCKKENNNE